jgi:hypothetical protein
MAILQSLLKTAKAVEAEIVRHTNDPKQNRREKFMQALSDQLTLLTNASATKDARRRRKQTDGSYAQQDVKIKLKSWMKVKGDQTVMTPKYGNTLLEFERGRCALSMPSAKVPEVIKQLIQATNLGEMDAILQKAADARPKPKRGQKARKSTVTAATAVKETVPA